MPSKEPMTLEMALLKDGRSKEEEDQQADATSHELTEEEADAEKGDTPTRRASRKRASRTSRRDAAASSSPSTAAAPSPAAATEGVVATQMAKPKIRRSVMICGVGGGVVICILAAWLIWSHISHKEEIAAMGAAKIAIEAELKQQKEKADAALQQTKDALQKMEEDAAAMEKRFEEEKECVKPTSVHLGFKWDNVQGKCVCADKTPVVVDGMCMLEGFGFAFEDCPVAAGWVDQRETAKPVCAEGKKCCQQGTTNSKCEEGAQCDQRESTNPECKAGFCDQRGAKGGVINCDGGFCDQRGAHGWRIECSQGFCNQQKAKAGNDISCTRGHCNQHGAKGKIILCKGRCDQSAAVAVEEVACKSVGHCDQTGAVATKITCRGKEVVPGMCI